MTPSLPKAAGYSGTPLPKKLGIRPGTVVALHGAPADFAHTLGELPAGARVHAQPRATRQLTIWFLATERELARVAVMADHCASGPMWICWPKKASGVASEVTENDIRNAALAHGIVDYKVCAIDATWSGLAFARRKS